MDPLTLIMFAVLAVLIFFMFRNTRKRQAEQRELQSKIATGASVMTNFGVYGTILSMDEEKNEVLLESTPGTVLNVHRQTIARVVEPTFASEIADEAAQDIDDSEPEFGERVPESLEETEQRINLDKKNDD